MSCNHKSLDIYKVKVTKGVESMCSGCFDHLVENLILSGQDPSSVQFTVDLGDL